MACSGRVRWSHIHVAQAEDVLYNARLEETPGREAEDHGLLGDQPGPAMHGAEERRYSSRAERDPERGGPGSLPARGRRPQHVRRKVMCTFMV